MKRIFAATALVQVRNLVWGLEADFQGSAQRDDKVCLGWCGPPLIMATTYDQKMTWFGTARARVGYAVASTLFYATGGLAYGNVTTNVANVDSFVPVNQTQTFSFAHTKTGYAVGAGIESPFNIFGLLGPNWTAKTEYLFVDLGRVSDSFSNPFGANFTVSSRIQEHVLRSGLNYHLNEPVVAKY